MRTELFSGENRKWWTLAAVAFGLFMIMLDNTIVNVALPAMQRSLHLKISELEWVVAGYALTFGGFTLTGGKLADMIGRRRIFVIGLVIFTGSSFACGLSTDGGELIGWRVVQGIGAALMNPTTLSIITVTFPRHLRGTAIGIWAGISAVALAVGPLLGGVISERINWNWIFFINVPVGVLGIVAALVFIDESRDTSSARRLDLPGLSTSALALLALSYALIESNNYGWTSARILAAFATAAVALTAFVLLEFHQSSPMLDLHLFSNRVFAGANTTMLLVGLGMFGVFFYISLYVQNVLGYSATQAGASFMPWTVLIMFLAPQTGRLSDRVGSRGLVAFGMTTIAGSMFLFSRMGEHESFWALLPAMLLGGVGMSATMPPVTSAAMRSVRSDAAGVGSAVLNTMRQVGGSIGIASMGAIIAASVSQPGQHEDPAEFLRGLHHALEMSLGIMLLGAVIAFATLGAKAEEEPHPSKRSAIATD